MSEMDCERIERLLGNLSPVLFGYGCLMQLEQVG
jgi:hypothetical protein